MKGDEILRVPFLKKNPDIRLRLYNKKIMPVAKFQIKPKRDLNGIIVCYAPAGGRYRHLYSKQDAWSYQCTYNSDLCKGY